MSILTITLNAAIDKRYDLDAIELGAVQRVARVRASAGGKGLNVARGAQLCGQQVLATGFVAGFAGRFVTSEIVAQGMKNHFVEVAGETRTCINLIEADARSTEFLEPGVQVGAADLTELHRRLAELVDEVDVVAISGSAPDGCPRDVYGPLVSAVNAAGKPVILDTSGDRLAAALGARPSFIKPNREELAALTGTDPTSLAELVDTASQLSRQGPEWVVVSLGAEGAIAVSADRAVQARAPKVELANPVGCGDVLVGGLASGLATGLAVPDALELAVRVSAAAAAHPNTGEFDPAYAESLRGSVAISELK